MQQSPPTPRRHTHSRPATCTHLSLPSELPVPPRECSAGAARPHQPALHRSTELGLRGTNLRVSQRQRKQQGLPQATPCGAGAAGSTAMYGHARFGGMAWHFISFHFIALHCIVLLLLLAPGPPAPSSLARPHSPFGTGGGRRRPARRPSSPAHTSAAIPRWGLAVASKAFSSQLAPLAYTPEFTRRSGASLLLWPLQGWVGVGWGAHGRYAHCLRL
jgi:hypothetical protein